MKRQILNDSLVHFKELMTATRAELHRMQGSPIGTEPRSPQEEAAMWKKITSLPDQEFQGFMDKAAEKSGHTNDEQEPCDLCRFVLKHATKGNVSA